MSINSDMGSFPCAGMPVLKDVGDRITLGTFYQNPLKSSGFIIDVLGNTRLGGTATVGGAMTVSGAVAMSGALSGATTGAFSSNVTVTGSTTSGSFATTGDISSILSRVRKGYFKDLEVTNTPTVLGEPVALIADLVRKQDALVSGVNIKTINSESLLGSGDISISASPGGSDTQVQFNDGGVFGGQTGFEFNKTTETLATPKAIVGSTTDDGSGCNLQVSSGGDVEVTIGDVYNATGEAVAGTAFIGDGTTQSFIIYAYKTVAGVNVYSTSGSLVDVVLPSDYQQYNVSLSWDPVAEASGYKVIWQYQAWTGAESYYVWDGTGSGTTSVTPSSPYYVNQLAISAPSGIITSLIQRIGGNITISAPSDEGGDYKVTIDTDRVEMNSVDINGDIYKNGNLYAITNPMGSDLNTSQYKIVAYDTVNYIAYPLQLLAGEDLYNTPNAAFIRGGLGLVDVDYKYGAVVINGNNSPTEGLVAPTGSVLIGRGLAEDDGIHELQVDGVKTIYSRYNPLYESGIFVSIGFIPGTLIPTGQTLPPPAAYQIIPYFSSPLGVVFCNDFQAGMGGATAPEDSDLQIVWNDINGLDTYDGIRILKLADNTYVDLAYDATSFTDSPSVTWLSDAVITPTSRTVYGKSALFTGSVKIAGSLELPYKAVTDTYTVINMDYTIDCDGTFTVTLPTAVGIVGRIFNIKNTGTGVITVACDGSETIDGETTQTLNQWETRTVQSTNTNWIII